MQCCKDNTTRTRQQSMGLTFAGGVLALGLCSNNGNRERERRRNGAKKHQHSMISTAYKSYVPRLVKWMKNAVDDVTSRTLLCHAQNCNGYHAVMRHMSTSLTPKHKKGDLKCQHRITSTAVPKRLERAPTPLSLEAPPSNFPLQRPLQEQFTRHLEVSGSRLETIK